MVWSCRIIHGVEAFRLLDMMVVVVVVVEDPGFLWVDRCPHSESTPARWLVATEAEEPQDARISATK